MLATKQEPRRFSSVAGTRPISTAEEPLLYTGAKGTFVTLESVGRELLLGPAYFYHRRLIAASKHWSPEAVQEYQQRRVRPLLARFGDHVRNKTHYRAKLELYSRLGFPGFTKTIHTGGTTGTPFSFQIDTFFRRQKERAYLFDIWADVGYQPFDTRVVFRGNIGNGLISHNRIENAWSISPARLNASTRGEVLSFLRSLGPFYLHVYPSSLFTLITALGDADFRTLSLRGVMAGSEAFPPAQIDSFERDYRVRIAHWYGHSEYASLAHYCRECRGFHFYPTYGLTEFLPFDQHSHRIVATSFNLIGTRFVRYDTGDLARLSERCCSQPFPRVDSVEGRVQEYFIDREGARHAFGPYLFGIHNRFWGLVSAIQFCHQAPGHLEVRIVLKASPDESQEAKRIWIEKFLRARFAIVDLNFQYATNIEPTAAGKHRYFINELDSSLHLKSNTLPTDDVS